jgi:hypothetical protein
LVLQIGVWRFRFAVSLRNAAVRNLSQYSQFIAL